MSVLNKNSRIAIAGAGTMGSGIAQVAASHGHHVRLYDLNSDAVRLAITSIARRLEKLVNTGRKDRSDVEVLISRIEPCHDLSSLDDSDLVIEAIGEDEHIKKQLFKQLEAVCPPDTIFATNTSSLSITALAAGLMRPENMVGMHFFNPAPVMKLVEVVSGAATAEHVAESVYQIALDWKKFPVYANSSPGFIVNRVARSFYLEPLRLLEETAASIETMDLLFRESGGFRMGPFELMDLIGNDVNYAVTETIYHAFSRNTRYQPSKLQRELVVNGSLGRKSGLGWYDYREEKQSMGNLSHSRYRPQSIEICGQLGVAADLKSVAESSGIQVETKPGEGVIRINNTTLALTDGRTANNRSSQAGEGDFILFDLLADYTHNQHIAIAASPQTSKQGLDRAIGFFNTLGKTVSQLDDTPGLCLMRTICMLANEASDAVDQGVCEVSAVDRAMKYGLNYPMGPLEWADRISPHLVCKVLNNLQRSDGSDRYRCSPLMLRKSDAGQTFHQAQSDPNVHEQPRS